MLLGELTFAVYIVVRGCNNFSIAVEFNKKIQYNNKTNLFAIDLF